MDKKITDRLSFIQNRCILCLYKKYEYLDSYENFLWEHISRIAYFYDEPVRCPICYSKPCLPRMDRCGHIFCLLCLQTLFQYSGDGSCECPVCKDARISASSLKRVSFIRSRAPAIGQSISLDLLVKDRPNGYPRPAHHLYSYSVSRIAPLSSAMANSSGVAIDQDRTVIEAVRADLRTLKTRKLGPRPGEVVRLSIELLERELEQLLDARQESSGDEAQGERGGRGGAPRGVRRLGQGEVFNLLEARGAARARARLFYGGREHRLVFLERGQAEWLLGRAAGGAEDGPPVAVTGTVVARRTERVSVADAKGHAVLAAGGRAPFEGALVTVVWLDTGLGSALRMTRASAAEIVELRRHRAALREESARCEKYKEDMAALAVARRSGAHSGGVSRMMTSMMQAMKRRSDPLSPDAAAVSRTPGIKTTTDSVFNTCMIGIDCVDPDDEYPHAETCPYFRPLTINESLPLELPQQSSQSQSSTPSQSPQRDDSQVNNTEKEMYFGLLQLKLNVYYPEKSHQPVDEPNNPTNVRVEPIRNHHPEKIVLSDLPPSLQIDNFEKYVVQKKPNTPRQRKQKRKSRKVNGNSNGKG